MALLKTKTKLAKHEFELDAALVERLKKTLKRIKELGDIELPINQEVQRFLTKLLDSVDKELDAIESNKTV